MAVAAQNAPNKLHRESLKYSRPYWVITRPKINIFDWTFLQVLKGHRIHVITNLELESS